MIGDDEELQPTAPATLHADTGLYYVEAVGLGLVKIGWSVQVQRRIASLQTACPVELKLLAVRSGDRALERHAHARLNAQRTRGEWFRLDDVVRAEIDEALAATPRTNALSVPLAAKGRAPARTFAVEQLVLDIVERTRSVVVGRFDELSSQPILRGIFRGQSPRDLSRRRGIGIAAARTLCCRRDGTPVDVRSAHDRPWWSENQSQPIAGEKLKSIPKRRPIAGSITIADEEVKSVRDGVELIAVRKSYLPDAARSAVRALITDARPFHSGSVFAAGSILLEMLLTQSMDRLEEPGQR